MKLGRQTVNLISAYQAGAKQVAPVVGMGATVCHWTDRHAGTVLWFDQMKQIVCIRRDKATCQDRELNLGWKYEPDPKGSQYRFKFKDGVWRQLEQNYWTESTRWTMCKKGSGSGLILGIRDEYYDPAF